MNEITSKFTGILENEDLSKYCTFRIGGPADYFYRAKDTEILIELIKYAKAEGIPYYLIGGGSNILFDDVGFKGLIIKLETEKIEIVEDIVTADAGVLISKLIKAAVGNGLSGLEKWVGLPGTVGGAVRGNAGCNGLETKDILLKAVVMDPKTAEVKEVFTDYFDFDYRTSKIKKNGEIVLSATFQLTKQGLDEDEQQEVISEIRTKRQTTQPFESSGGSFFKNPSKENPAGMLIDKAGLKRTIIGKAQISEKHGNFFLNLGGATADDMLKLAQLAKDKVKEKFGIELIEEVQYIAIENAL